MSDSIVESVSPEPQIGVVFRDGEAWASSVSEGLRIEAKIDPKRLKSDAEAGCIHSSTLTPETCSFCRGLDPLPVVGTPTRSRRIAASAPLVQKSEDILAKYGKPTSWSELPAFDGQSRDCLLELHELSLRFACKFVGHAELDGDALKKDLASVGMLHVLLKAEQGKLAKVPVADRWKFIKTMLWNKFRDESRKYRPMRVPVIANSDGDEMASEEWLSNTDAAVEAVKQSYFDQLTRLSHTDLRLFSGLLSTAFAKLPPSDSTLIKMFFGLVRNDEFTGFEDGPKFLDAMSMSDLEDYGYGDRFEIRRRIDRVLVKLRVLIMADIERRHIQNFVV